MAVATWPAPPHWLQVDGCVPVCTPLLSHFSQRSIRVGSITFLHSAPHISTAAQQQQLNLPFDQTCAWGQTLTCTSAATRHISNTASPQVSDSAQQQHAPLLEASAAAAAAAAAEPRGRTGSQRRPR